MAPLTLPARRPVTSLFYADENSLPMVKRAKKSPSATTTATTTTLASVGITGRVLLGNITNTHRRVCKSHGKPLIGSSLKKSYVPPPSSPSSTKPSRAKGKAVTVPAISLPTPSISSSADLVGTGLLGGLGLIKDSWIFDIYEDSPEETLQNMMEFSTRALDISDRCILDVGKENIPPEQMPLPPLLPLPVPAVSGKEPPAARRKRGGEEKKKKRSALKELELEELELFAATAEDKTKPSMPPQATTATTSTTTTGVKNLKAAGWKIWEPDSAAETSSSLTLVDGPGSSSSLQSLSVKGRKRPLED